MINLFKKLLEFNQNNTPCKIIKNDGVVCFAKFIKDFKWVKEELKDEFTVKFISNTEEELTLSSFEIKEILPIGGE